MLGTLWFVVYNTKELPAEIWVNLYASHTIKPRRTHFLSSWASPVTGTAAAVDGTTLGREKEQREKGNYVEAARSNEVLGLGFPKENLNVCYIQTCDNCSLLPLKIIFRAGSFTEF